MEKKGLSLWIAVLVIAAAVLMLAVSADAVDAARGGKIGCKGGPKHCGGDTSTAVLTVTPNPVPLGSQSVAISGTGFGANEYVVVTLPGACCDVGATTDGTGAFSVTFYRNFDWPSTYTVEVYRAGVKVASTTFTVQ